MSKQNLFLGRSGEEAAGRFLKEKGYKILKRNYKSKLGEIDIIAQDRDTLCFIEVKTRRSLKYGLPSEAVCGFKQSKISKAALVYLKENNQLDSKARFDVLSVTYSQDHPKFDLVQNAFELRGHFTY